MHIVPGFQVKPKGHFATWLPQIAAAWNDNPEFEIHWLTVSRNVNHPEPVKWMGQTFHTIYVPEKLRTFRLYSRDCSWIKKKLKELRPDVVHAWGTEDCCGLAAARSGYPFLLSMQGILTEYARCIPPNIFERVQSWIEKFVLKRARNITVESTWGMNLMKTLAPHAQVERVEYGVSDYFYHVAWQPDEQEPYAIFVGSPCERKGIRDALAAFSSPPLSNRKLLVAGGDVDIYRDLSPPNVVWLGRKSRDETAQLMSRASCLVLPTRADTSPNVVKEARVIGLPIVTTAHGGQADYVIDDETGYIVEAGDIDTLSKQISAILESPSLAQRLGNARHEEHREWFRTQNTAARFLEVYRRLAASRP